jgi:hypothetical protein
LVGYAAQGAKIASSNLVGEARELIHAHLVEGFVARIDMQRISLAVEPRRVERHDVLMAGKEAPRFDDEKRDVPSSWIDERAHELSEDGVGWADNDGGPIESVRGGPKLICPDKAEVVVHRVHGASISKLRHPKPPVS